MNSSKLTNLTRSTPHGPLVTHDKRSIPAIKNSCALNVLRYMEYGIFGMSLYEVLNIPTSTQPWLGNVQHVVALSFEEI